MASPERPQLQHGDLVEAWSGNGTAEVLDERAARRGLDDHPFEGTTVLVIDDDFRNVFAMTALLERARATVVSAESGAAAIELLRQTPIDIVLMDIMMPTMDGYETTRAIRSLTQFATIPIIAVTGKVVAGERERCLEAGANGYVPKPVDTVELLLAVGRWLPDSATRARATGVDRMTAPPGLVNHTALGVNVPDAPILIIDDNAAKRLALRSVLVSLGYSIVEADGGIAALRCVIAEDFAVILCDVRMPAVDGFETARLIRKRQQSELTPIIFLTAFGSGDIDRTDLYAEGAVDFMFAPVPPAELRAKVAAFAGIFIKAERLAAEARQVQADIEELRVLNEELSAIARLDGLTGLGNRRALEEDLTQLDARVIRYGHRYCLAILDLDYFKSYNDAYGHLAGDHILQSFALELKRQARSGDALYRYGGDEFLVVFPEQSLTSGLQAVERLQRNMERLALVHEGNPLQVVTFSAGLAVLSQDLVKSANAILKEADDALYRAKDLGRNRVEAVSP